MNASFSTSSVNSGSVSPAVSTVRTCCAISSFSVRLQPGWTSEQSDEVRIALDALPDQCSLKLWEEVVDRNFREPEFIRRQLHCRIRAGENV
jgi:hypothetical protein